MCVPNLVSSVACSGGQNKVQREVVIIIIIIIIIMIIIMIIIIKEKNSKITIGFLLSRQGLLQYCCTATANH